MKTRYLNNELKKEIRGKIESSVTAKMEKSIPGKEFKSTIKQIIKRLRALALDACPEKDMEVLKKYSLTYSHSSFSITVSEKGEVHKTWYSDRRNGLVIDPDPAIETQNRGPNDSYLVDLIKSDQATIDLCVLAYRSHNHIQCEINETVEAYMVRVDKFRTIKTLLVSHPSMKKFIPKEAAPMAPPEPSRADKLIDQFEAA